MQGQDELRSIDPASSVDFRGNEAGSRLDHGTGPGLGPSQRRWNGHDDVGGLAGRSSVASRGERQQGCQSDDQNPHHPVGTKVKLEWLAGPLFGQTC